MTSIVAQLDTHFRAAIRSAWGVDADPLIAISGNEKFGDYQSNAAMGLAKTLSEKTGQKQNPRSIAEKIKENLKLSEIATEISIAGPGFINVRLSPQWLEKQLVGLAADRNLGVEQSTTSQRVVVDYSGPNIAKEMHVGHLRSTIIGDAISRAIEAQGHQVIRQNHIGDWGTQFGMLIAYLKKYASNVPKITTKDTETGRTIPLADKITDYPIVDLEDFYRRAKEQFDSDSTFATAARESVVNLQGGKAEECQLWAYIVKETRRSYQPLYKRLGVKLRQEHERGESFYNPFLADVVRELKQKGLAIESEGAIVVPVEGFEAPLIIEKTGGGYLYATTDLAAIRYRIQELKANRIIYTHDSRQSQHFAQVFATAKKAGWAEGVSLEYAPFGTMLGEDGKPFKTRSGGTVKLKDLLDEAEQRGYALAKSKDEERVAKARERGEADARPMSEEQLIDIGKKVGIGAVKYADLSKDRTSDYVFAWDRMLAMDGNTAPYLQYAYARVRAIFRRANVPFGQMETTQIQLEAAAEIALAKQIVLFGEVVELIARELKPHHLASYLYELAIRFSSFYDNCNVLDSPEPTRSSRLALSELTARTMATGLDILGIAHPEQM